MSKIQRRAHFFIDNKYQKLFVIRFCIVTFATSVLMMILVLMFTQDSTTVAFEHTRVVVKSTADFIFPLLVATVCAVSVFSAVIVMLLTLYESHKIVGPAYRLNQEIELIKKGHLGRKIIIRENDQLRDLAIALESMSATLKRRSNDIEGRLHAVTCFLAERKCTVTEADSKKFKILLDELVKSSHKFKTD